MFASKKHPSLFLKVVDYTKNNFITLSQGLWLSDKENSNWKANIKTKQ
jgi:hypothetical protein